MENRHCLHCGDKVIGRTDKKFCDDGCRSSFNNRLNSDSSLLMKSINTILRKNRRILEEFIQEEESTGRASRKKLEDKGYHFSYHTHTYTNKSGLTYFFCYEYGFLPLENDYYMIVKSKDA
jgi:hypothetical protein